MNKKEFIFQVESSCLNMDHITERKLDYKYNEYLLFKILIKYGYEDFKILGLPKSIEIKIFPGKEDYNIYSRTHVTLNYQLYKLYECGYYDTEKKLVDATLKAIQSYNSGNNTIRELDNGLRKIRMEYIRENKELIN